MAPHFCNVECARKEHKHGKKGIPLAAILMDHHEDMKNERMFGDRLLPLMKRVLMLFLVYIILSAMVKRYYYDNGDNGEDCTAEFEEYMRKQQY